MDQYYSPEFMKQGKSISKWDGFLDQIDHFDNKFFNISPWEVRNIGPQQLTLQENWPDIENSGPSLTTLDKKIIYKTEISLYLI